MKRRLSADICQAIGVAVVFAGLMFLFGGGWETVQFRKHSAAKDWSQVEDSGWKDVRAKGSGFFATFAPLLASRHIEDREEFHRLAFSDSLTASDAVLFRAPNVTEDGANRRVLTVAKRVTPLPVDFAAPRTEWRWLTRATRNAIDTGLAAGGAWSKVVLHGSGTGNGSAGSLDRLHRGVRGLAGGLAHHFVIGNGNGSVDGEVEASARWQAGREAILGDATKLGDGVISVCLIGDFNKAGPTEAQLQALDELVDYLTMKTGWLPVVTHAEAVGGSVSCLGPLFPGERIAAAFARGQE